MGTINGNINAIGKKRSLIPSVLNDGNTWIWGEFKRNVTVDVTDVTDVTEWGDRRGGNYPSLTPAFIGTEPTLRETGIYFNGVNNVLTTGVLPLNQPITVYAIMRQISWTANDILFDGGGTLDCALRQRTSSPSVNTFAGANTPINGDLVLNTFSIVRVVFNGVSSTLQVDENTKTTGDVGTIDPEGFTLGASGAGTSAYSEVEYQEFIVREGVDSEKNQGEIYTYLEKKKLT